MLYELSQPGAPKDLLFKKNIYLFNFEREKEHVVGVGGGAEGERDSQADSLLSRAQGGLRSHNSEPKSSLMFNQLSHPSAPKYLHFLKILFIWETERAHVHKSISRGGAGGAEGRALSAEQGAQCRAWSQDSEIMAWAKGRRLTDCTTQLPLKIIFNAKVPL